MEIIWQRGWGRLEGELEQEENRINILRSSQFAMEVMY